MAAISEYPELIESIFVTKEVNRAGIYALRFFIRGKPWIITIDDEFAWSRDKDELLFAKLGSESQIWGPLVEKAWAKMKGSYDNADGGFGVSGTRALIGCPVYYWKSEHNMEFTTEVFEFLLRADGLDFFMSADTGGGGDDTRNECGIANSHSYSIISAFKMNGHNMLMIRNPWGSTDYSIDWNSEDPNWNLADNIDHVPYDVDPRTSNEDGIFFVEDKDFMPCFEGFQVGVYREDEGYANNWFDVENDDAVDGQYFEVVVPENNGDMYFSVETYY